MQADQQFSSYYDVQHAGGIDLMSQSLHTDFWSVELAVACDSIISSPLYACHSKTNGQYIRSGVSPPMPWRLPQAHSVELHNRSHRPRQDSRTPQTGWSSHAVARSMGTDSLASNGLSWSSLPASAVSLTVSASPDFDPGKSSGIDSQRNIKACSHCQTTSTPLWRREPVTLRVLCNACGLYLQQRNKLRPQELIDADNDYDDDTSLGPDDGTRPECSHCHTRNTSEWRRSRTGDQLCNACGVYLRLKGKERPLFLKRNTIKRRLKHSK
ncbi:hypothetical protein C8J56DRAFT_838723 [Mycena floridula]|nr:hypothetical protein C8J56DRAFT_838723 [Mycena floridula]